MLWWPHHWFRKIRVAAKLVSALASMNGPEHLNFVFLDFKGGSAFRKLERLPHTVGSVCDLIWRMPYARCVRWKPN